MTNNEFRKKAYAILGALVFVLLVMTIAIANASTPPTSRITAEPEWLEPNEEDDGKFAIMIDKGVLCDKRGLIFNRYHSRGFVSAFRGISKSGFETYILLRSGYRDGRYWMNEMIILEIDNQSNIACVISENTNAEYNEEHIYLEIYPGGRDI